MWSARSSPEFGNTQIRLAVKGATMLAFVLSVTLMASFWFAPLVLEAAKQPPEVITLAMGICARLEMGGILPSLIIVLCGLTDAFGIMRFKTTVMSVITVILNVPVSYFLTID